MTNISTIIQIVLTLTLVGLAIRAELEVSRLKSHIAKMGYNPDAKDGDKDGLVQDGTKWERPVN